MTWTIHEVEDDYLVMRSSEPADIGRLLRACGLDGLGQVMNGRRIPELRVTIFREVLDNDHQQSTIPSDTGGPESDSFELPF